MKAGENYDKIEMLPEATIKAVRKADQIKRKCERSFKGGYYGKDQSDIG